MMYQSVQWYGWHKQHTTANTAGWAIFLPFALGTYAASHPMLGAPIGGQQQHSSTNEHSATSVNHE